MKGTLTKFAASTMFIGMLVSPFSALAAITYQSGSWHTGTSFAFTATGGTNSIVLILTENGTTDNCSVSYGGSAATSEGSVKLPTADEWYHLWSFKNGTAGSNTIAVSGCTNYYGTEVHEYTNVSGAAGFASNTNSGGSISGTWTAGATTDFILSWASGRFGPHALTVSTGVTNDRSLSGSLAGFGESDGTGGSVSHTWNNANSSDNAILGLIITESTGGGGTTTATTTTATSTATTADVLAFLLPPFIVLAVAWTILGIMLLI